MNQSRIVLTAAVALAALPAVGAGPLPMYTVNSTANVRAAPTTNSQRIGTLAEGKKVRVLGDAVGGNWREIRMESGQMGFVFSKLLTADPTAEGSGDKTALTGGPTPAPEDAFAYIVWPTDGEIIPGGDFVVLFGLHGMGVTPAGVEKEATGHHHLLIDTDLPPLDKAIPSTDNIVHFGRGQTEYHLTFPKGRHTLQLLLGDANHIPHTPPVMSERIAITVP
jgi:uncharacterized protein YgiM (DUF1202 family)